MKKYSPIVLSLAIICGFLATALKSCNVFAAYAYLWLVNDGESLELDKSKDPSKETVYKNKDGSAIWHRMAPFEDGGVLTLTNYNGGKLKLACYGTGLGHTFKIELVGKNNISAEGDAAIVSDSPIEIVGDGTLNVTANKLLSYEASDGYNRGNLNIKINSDITNQSATPETEQVIEQNEKDQGTTEDIELDVREDEEKIQDINWKLMTIIFASVSVLELIIIIAFCCKNVKKKKIGLNQGVVTSDIENKPQNEII